MKSTELADAPGAADGAVVRGTVKVTVLDPGGTGAPAVGANVVFLDPDGSVVKKAATDTLGKASADVLPGGSVTSILVSGTATQLQTVTAVKPGDDLVIGAKFVDSTVSGTYTVTFPTFAGAAQYELSSPCGRNFVAQGAGTSLSYTFTIYNYCRVASMELALSATDANGAPIAVLSKANIPYVPGGAATITDAYQSPRTVTGSYTNINPVVSAITMSRSVPDALGVITSGSMTSPATSVTLTLTGPSASTALLTTAVANTSRSQQAINQTLAGTAVTYGVDAGATLLGWLGTPTYDAANRKLVIPRDNTGSSGDAPDAFRAVASYRRTDPVSGAVSSYSWTFYGPTSTDITFPTLPAELAPIAPTTTDTVSGNAIMFEADNVTSYDDVRNDLGGAFSLYIGSQRTPAKRIRSSRTPLLRL